MRDRLQMNDESAVRAGGSERVAVQPDVLRRGLAFCALAWPAWPAGAQQPGRTYRLGWLSSTERQEPYALAMVQRLRELGFVEGGNLSIEFRLVPAREDAFLRMAEELGRLNCDALFASGHQIGLSAALQGTQRIPIITVANDIDPVAAGFVASLARPGGRITGVSQLMSELPGKRLEVVRELLPRARRVAVLADAVTKPQLQVTRAAAAKLGFELVVHEFDAPPYDLPAAFGRFKRAGAEVMVSLASAFFAVQRKAIVALATQHRLPGIFPNAVWADAGGLMSYGPNFLVSYRRAADILAKVFNGADPAVLPMEQPQVIETVLNLGVAKRMGVAIPQAIALRADRVVE